MNISIKSTMNAAKKAWFIYKYIDYHYISESFLENSMQLICNTIIIKNNKLRDTLSTTNYKICTLK